MTRKRIERYASFFRFSRIPQLSEDLRIKNKKMQKKYECILFC